MPRRFDLSTEPLRKPEKTPQGYLRSDGFMARTGVLTYQLGGGKVRRELRLPEDVFHKDSMASWEMLPVTEEHPPEMLTAANTREYSVGHVGENVRPEGDFVRGTVLLTDAEAVKAAESGDKVELSGGYDCDLEMTSGTHNGQHYDAIQRNIRMNHLALVPHGRSGPSVSLHLDAEDGLQVAPPPSPTPGATVKFKIRIDGTEVEVDEQTYKAWVQHQTQLEKERKDAVDSRKALETELEKTRARADAAEAAKSKADKERTDAADPKRFDAAVKARVALESKACEVLGAEVKLDGLDDQAVKVEVLKKLDSKLKLEGKSPEYIAHRFDFELERFDAETPELDKARSIATPKPGKREDEEHLDLGSVRADYLEATENAWRKPLTASRKLELTEADE